MIFFRTALAFLGLIFCIEDAQPSLCSKLLHKLTLYRSPLTLEENQFLFDSVMSRNFPSQFYELLPKGPQQKYSKALFFRFKNTIALNQFVSQLKDSHQFPFPLIIFPQSTMPNIFVVKSSDDLFQEAKDHNRFFHGIIIKFKNLRVINIGKMADRSDIFFAENGRFVVKKESSLFGGNLYWEIEAFN